MRRSFSLIALGALTALAVGSAAALDVDGGAIQAGEDLTLTCDDDGVHVAGWGLEADDGLVYGVRIGGISDDCFGNALFVNVTDGAGGVIAQGGVQKPPGGTGITSATQSVSFSTAVDAALIEDIHVFIEGPAAPADL